MTRDEALDLLGEYSEIAEHLLPASRGCHHESAMLGHLAGMRDRFPADGSERKAMRWVGYMQGALVTTGVFTLDEVKEHSRRKRVAS